MGYSVLTDTDLQYKVLGEHLDQHEKIRGQHWVVKLPCHNESYEIPKAQTDTYLACSVCGKRYLMTHSAVSNKLYSKD